MESDPIDLVFFGSMAIYFFYLLFVFVSINELFKRI